MEYPAGGFVFTGSGHIIYPPGAEDNPHIIGAGFPPPLFHCAGIPGDSDSGQDTDNNNYYNQFHQGEPAAAG